MVKFVQVTAKTVPWSQKFSLKFFFGKERASREAARRGRSSLSPPLCLRLVLFFPNKTFMKNLWDQGIKTAVAVGKFSAEISLNLNLELDKALQGSLKITQ